MNGQERTDGSLINNATDDKGKMFVGGLSWETDENKLRDYFKKFGEVRDCMIKRDQETKRSRGFGFILFADANSVEQVLETSEHHLDGRNIDPKRAKALRKDSKLFVGGLNPDTTEETIKKYFEDFGEIDTIERPRDRTTQKARGFCFITFTKDGVIGKIMEQSKYHTIDGRQCECKDGDSRKQARGRGAGGNEGPGEAAGGFNNGAGGYGGQGQWPGAAGQQNWFGGYPQTTPGYDYGSGYGGYGGYGGGYAGYAGYGAGYGGYGGYGNYQGYGDGYQAPQAPNSGNQNSGGKARAAGRGGQNNFKPY